MTGFSSAAILMRRLEFSDYDVIVDFLTQDYGRITAIAKNAKKSKKRFAGVLELFSRLEAEFVPTRSGSGLPLLKSVDLTHPFAGIRLNIEKTAYASYWSEMVNRWGEEGSRQPGLFSLLHYALSALDDGDLPHEKLSILFQIRFMALTGLSPGLGSCRLCRRSIDTLSQKRIAFDVVSGGIVCQHCCQSRPGGDHRHSLSLGTVKRLLWLKESDLPQATRLQFNNQDQVEALEVMEMFVRYHLSFKIKSLKVLRDLRREKRENLYV